MCGLLGSVGHEFTPSWLNLGTLPSASSGRGLSFFMVMVGASQSWVSLMPCVAEGFTVAALDCRGEGGRSQDIGSVKGTTLRGHIIRGLDDTPNNLLFCYVFLDTAQLAGIVMDLPEVDPARVGAHGGSQGGGLTLVCAALEPRIKRAVPFNPFLLDYQRVWEMDQAQRAYEELSVWFRLHDPRHKRQEEVFRRLGYIDVQHLALRIYAEILWGIGLSDTTCPPSTQFAAYNKIVAPKRMDTYPDYGHEMLPQFDEAAFAFLREL